MFKKETWIFLADTDATGVIFYPKLLEKCLWAYEMFLNDKQKDLKFFFGESFFSPVVNVQLDFMHPLHLSEKVLIELRLERIGTTSFTFQYAFYNSKRILAAKAVITHVLVDQKSREKTNIPDELRSFFEQNLA